MSFDRWLILLGSLFGTCVFFIYLYYRRHQSTSSVAPGGYSEPPSSSAEARFRQTAIVANLDTNGDGVKDVTLMDTTGDGKPDMVLDKQKQAGGKPNFSVHANGDGKVIAMLVDSNQDGSYDKIVQVGGLTEIAVAARAEHEDTSEKSHQCPYPSYWVSKGGGVNIQESEYIFNFAHDLLNKTFKSVATRDRTARMPEWLQPIKIWRIENSIVFQRYWRYRVQVQRKYKDRGPRAAAMNVVDPLPETHALLPAPAQAGLDKEVSEHYLFHGTSPEGAVGIYRAGFDITRAGSSAGSLYGPGLYFSECSSKGDEYAVEDLDGIYAGHCAVLLCRVVLGSTLVWEQESDPAQINAAMAQGQHDSILGDRQKLRGTYREFVLPAQSHHGAYPEYIIIYKRRYTSRRKSGSPPPTRVGSSHAASPKPHGMSGGRTSGGSAGGHVRKSSLP